MTLYVYTVVRERMDGTRGKKTKKLCRWENNLRVGGLYVHLGNGFPGMQRVLSMTTEELPD